MRALRTLHLDGSQGERLATAWLAGRLPAHRLIGGYQTDQWTVNSSPLECIGELQGGGHVAGARPPHHCAARHRRDACSTAWRRKQTTRNVTAVSGAGRGSMRVRLAGRITRRPYLVSRLRQQFTPSCIRTKTRHQTARDVASCSAWLETRIRPSGRRRRTFIRVSETGRAARAVRCSIRSYAVGLGARLCVTCGAKITVRRRRSLSRLTG